MAVEYSADKEIKIVGEVSGETNKDPKEDDLFLNPSWCKIQDDGRRTA